METHPEPETKSFADVARQPPASSAIRKGNNAATSSTASMQKEWFGGQAIFVTKKGKKVTHTKEKLKELSEASKQTQGLGQLNEQTGKRIPQPAKKIKEISGASSTNSPTRTQVSRDLKEKKERKSQEANEKWKKLPESVKNLRNFLQENVPMDEIKGIVDVKELKSLQNDLARYLEQEQELTNAFSTVEVSSESDKCDPQRPQQIDQNLELLPDKKLSEGKNQDNNILWGTYKVPTAVKRLCKADYEMNAKKIQILIRESKYCSNLVRYYDVIPYKGYFYVPMEGECYSDETSFNLDELIQLDLANSNPSEVVANDRLKVVKKFELIPKNGCPIPDLLSKVMRKVLCGLVYLHALGISHGDLKPQNIRIVKEGSLWRVKLSDMGIKTGSGTLDTQACRDHGNHIWVDDMHAFRRIFLRLTERDSLLENYPEACHLFLSLTSKNPTECLTAKEALDHPFFWNPGAKLSFLLGTYEGVSTLEGKSIRNELETISSKVIVGKWKGEHVKEWNNRIDADIMKYATDQLNMYGTQNKTYKYKSLPDLLKLIRHTGIHYRECPSDIQKSLGSLGEGFYNYFESRFPNLFIEVYRVAVKWWGKENVAPSCWLDRGARRAAAPWIPVQCPFMGSMALQKSAPGSSHHNGSAKRAQHKGN